MKSTALRYALGANALFSASSGLVLVGVAEAAASAIGTVAPVVLRAVGGGLLLFAAFLLWTAWRPRPHPTYVLLATGADLAWVVGSAGLLLFERSGLTAVGRGAVAGVAVVVLALAIAQLIGLRALTLNRDGRTAARSAFEVRQRVAAPAGAIWGVVRDLEGIGRFHPTLRTVEVRGDGIGARRTCEDRAGQRWSEDVVAWSDRERTLTLTFDADADGFPFPVEEMTGGWRVEAAGEQAEVVVWFEYTVPGGVLGELVAPFIAQRSRSTFEATIANMEAEALRGAKVGAGL